MAPAADFFSRADLSGIHLRPVGCFACERRVVNNGRDGAESTGSDR
jgi:hypothetical protein